MIAYQKMADERVNDLDQELFSELTESLVQPLLVHVVPPFVDGKDENYCLQINGNVLWEWRILEGNSKKLFAVLQKNLQPNGYSLEKSAFDRVSLLLNTKTRTFVNKIKEERNGKRRRTKKAETWLKLSIYPEEISQSPYDIFAEMRNEHEILEESFHHLNATVEEKAAKLYEQMRDARTGSYRHKGRPFSDVSNKQQQRHLQEIQ